MKQKVIIGNCLDVMRSMPDDSVDVCVTSPPYWALRDYGSDPAIWGGSADCEHDWTDHLEPSRGGVGRTANVGANKDGEANNRGHPTLSHYCSKCGAWKGQLGLEPSPLEYIDHLMMVFDEVKRILKPTGACWVNIGDTYSTFSNSGQHGNLDNRKSADGLELANNLKKDIAKYGFPSKTLLQIPSRFAIAMTDRGWLLRNEIIWQKPNCMPTSVKDRFTVDFEKFFFFTKSQKYYFNQIKEELKKKDARTTFGSQKQGNFNNVYSGNLYDASKLDGRNMRCVWAVENTSKWKDDEIEASVRQGMNGSRGKGVVEKRYNLPDRSVFADYMRSHTDAQSVVDGADIPVTTAEHWFRKDEGGFAYPSVEDWLKVRSKVVSDDPVYDVIDKGLTDVVHETDDIMKNSDGQRNARCVWEISTVGSHEEHCAMFPKTLIERPIQSCCSVDGVVIDPFCGSGTVLEYCFEHDIEAIGIEINPGYKKIIDKRSRQGQTKLVFGAGD